MKAKSILDAARRFDPLGRLDRWWRWGVLAAWLAICGYWLWERWRGIYWLALSDTDDNMRLMQVRALLAGQSWYDLRQYRLSPPEGFDIHWSRIVDLPIAGLILGLRPFLGIDWAERMAVAIAPLLAFGVALIGLTLTVRRLIAPGAWPIAILFLFACTSTVLMFMPLRIDHHGWQLACLTLTVAGLADPVRRRGGLTVGLSSAVSLSIGLELLPYCAMAGAIVALRWVWDREEGERIRGYTLALGGGSTIGFLLFASEANRVLRCDALTPVWLSVMVGAAGLLLLIQHADPARRTTRLMLAAGAGVLIAAGFALIFPQCLARPEGVSDELVRTWLGNVREAKPIYRHPLRAALPIAIIPLLGLIGAALAAWQARDANRRVGWIAILLFTVFAGAMLLWQMRAAPAAQLLGIVGASALAWALLPWLFGRGSWGMRAAALLGLALLGSGLASSRLIRMAQIDPPRPITRTVSQANRRCQSLPAMRLLNRFPVSTMFTHVDLGPRLIAMTHHRAIAGPYHRNERAILDVHRAFTGSVSQARAILVRDRADYLLTCPNMAETTVYRARAPQGFYAQLVRGRVPEWLEPVDLPAYAPYRLWRIRNGDVERRTTAANLRGGTNQRTDQDFGGLDPDRRVAAVVLSWD